MQKTVIFYNQNEVIEDSSSQIELKEGYKLWIDYINPEISEITGLQKMFNLDLKAVEKIHQKSKMPQVKILKNQKFTVFLDLKFNGLDN
ncbi:MAG: hypothetical protein M3162_05820, partial [Thermoproteota archaeon]|nr:hypothetical protein [Thermoproteota archaeon]